MKNLLKASKKPVMRAERAKKPSLLGSSGIPKTPVVRPSYQKNKPKPSGVTLGKY